jgi:hypothetical protein
MKRQRQRPMRGSITAIGHDTISQTKSALPPVRLGLQPFAPWRIAEWQQCGPETLSGFAVPQAALDLCAGASRHDAKERRREFNLCHWLLLPGVAASEAIREIAWESDRQFGETRD